MRANFKVQASGSTGRSVTDLHDQVAQAKDQGEEAKPLAVLFESGQTIELQRGEILFHRGDIDRRLFAVLEGSVDVVVEGEGGQEQTLGRFGPGGVFGEVAFLLGGERSASSRIHSVRASMGGPRVSMSCFIGSTGEDERLILWN